jgi:hypothetical protein
VKLGYSLEIKSKIQRSKGGRTERKRNEDKIREINLHGLDTARRKSRLNLGSVFCHAVQKLLSSRLLSINVKK